MTLNSFLFKSAILFFAFSICTGCAGKRYGHLQRGTVLKKAEAEVKVGSESESESESQSESEVIAKAGRNDEIGKAGKPELNRFPMAEKLIPPDSTFEHDSIKSMVNTNPEDSIVININEQTKKAEKYFKKGSKILLATTILTGIGVIAFALVNIFFLIDISVTLIMVSLLFFLGLVSFMSILSLYYLANAFYMMIAYDLKLSNSKALFNRFIDNIFLTGIVCGFLILLLLSFFL